MRYETEGAEYTLTFCRPRPRSNFTIPVTRAKRVWSLPRPTLKPGKNLVPRWRTMMAPALTVSPPYAFTPRYCGLLSRPFLDDPPPLFVAMTVLAYVVS